MDLKTAHNKFITELKNTGKSRATIVAYEKDIEQLVNHLLELDINHVTKIDHPHLKSFTDKLSEMGLKNKTISRKINAIKTFFRYLHQQEHIKTNVAEDLKHPKFKLNPPRILSIPEYRALRDAARDNIRTFAMVEVLLQTGISISELSLIELSHLNLDQKPQTLTIPKRQSKKERQIPLNKAAVDAIVKYLESEKHDELGAKHLFITKTGNNILIRNIRSTIDRAFKLAGIENAKVNDLRHTFIAYHLENGVEPDFIAEVVGHKRESSVTKYFDYIKKKVEDSKREILIL